MPAQYEVYVSNVGLIGTYGNLVAAKADGYRTIKQSARADDHFIVVYDDDVVFEHGTPPE